MLERAASVVAAVILVFATGCDTGPTSPGDDRARVQVGFRSADGAASASSAAGVPARASEGELGVTGANGTLTITDVRFIVSELELERSDEGCDDAGNDDACEEVERGPLFLTLPLNGETAPAVEQEVEAGVYEEMEFEIEDLELDDDEDEEDGQAIQELFARIRAEIDDWPEEASLMLAGTFTPAEQGQEPVDFRTFFEAEIEIEREFEPPRTFEEGASITVVVDPARWLQRQDGTVMNLAELDFQRSGRVVELEAEMEDGFEKVEIETEDD